MRDRGTYPAAQRAVPAERLPRTILKEPGDARRNHEHRCRLVAVNDPPPVREVEPQAGAFADRAKHAHAGVKTGNEAGRSFFPESHQRAETGTREQPGAPADLERIRGEVPMQSAIRSVVLHDECPAATHVIEKAARVVLQRIARIVGADPGHDGIEAGEITSGEVRISNYLLWQCAYSELVFRDELWPEFTREAFRAALDEFEARHRRFGAR